MGYVPVIQFICEPCKEAENIRIELPGAKEMKDLLHWEHCKGGTWCDCQHRWKK